MMRSLFSGVSGLRNHQVRMDVIGNNIANVNTVGYKRARANFQEMLVQTLRGASAPQAGRGGTNPQQMGLGVSMGSIDSIFTQGSLQATGKVTDLAIQGDGFFVLSDGTEAASNRFYTRAGNFDLDRDGNLVDKSSGLKVMGYSVDDAGNVNTSGLIPVSVLVGSTFPPKATTSITYGGNLDAGATIGSSKDAPIDVYDAQGTLHRVIANFKKNNNNQWQYTIRFDRNSPLMQELLTTYYPTFDSMPAADQEKVLAFFNSVFLGWTAGENSAADAGGNVLRHNYYASGMGAASGPGLRLEWIGTGDGKNASVEIAVGASRSVTVATNAQGGSKVTITVQSGDTLTTVRDFINSDATAQQYLRAVLDDPASGGTTVAAEGETYLTEGGVGGYASASGMGRSSGTGLHVEFFAPGAAGNNYSVQILRDTTIAGNFQATITNNSQGGKDIVIKYQSSTLTLDQLKDWINDPQNNVSSYIRAVLDPTVGTGTTVEDEAQTFLKYGSTSVRQGSIIFSSAGIVDTDATRAANGATVPNLARSFIFQPTGTNPVEIVPDISSLTQYNSAFTVLAKKQNGNPSGTLQSVSISKNGRVSGVFSNGFTKEMAALALAVFNNPGGLFKVGDNLYQPSVNSGTEQIGTAEAGGRGTVVPGTLEMSNVDLAQEFTDMIITQRGFQANTRVITTSDEMLQELANLKR